MKMLSAASCGDLGLAANSAAGPIVKNYQKLDENCDRKTGHGRSQRVTLP